MTAEGNKKDRLRGIACALPGEPRGDIRRQVKLPLRKSVEIAVKSLRARFFRSAITTMTLVLAVAFLAFVDLTTDMANGMMATHDPGLYELLAQRGYELPEGAASFSSSPRQRWIIVLSLLVCVVGIVNAQLMAVTERFREIGTMKCLGALDRFVLRLFLLEAGFQGLFGATAGALAGFLFALVAGLLSFGTPALTCLPAAAALRSLASATGVGVLLSLIGVLYPALVASRMQPVVAMRSEI